MLAGCFSGDGTGDKGYLSGDGRITQVAAAERGDPVDLTGESLDHKPISLESLRGKPVVVNVWWSACGPCRAEQPMLNDVAASLKGKAAFVGINIRDASADQAAAYQRSFEVSYPSIFDPSGKALLAFRGALSPRTIPSTLVLDGEGRLAASIIGPVPSKLTLTELVQDLS